MCHCASNVRERNRGARPSVSSRDLKKRSRDFSDSQKSNFGVSSFSHTASSLQKRRILKDFFLSLSLVVVVRIGFAPPARHHCCVRAMMMMKSFSREKKRKRDQKEDTCEI